MSTPTLARPSQRLRPALEFDWVKTITMQPLRSAGLSCQLATAFAFGDAYNNLADHKGAARKGEAQNEDVAINTSKERKVARHTKPTRDIDASGVRRKIELARGINYVLAIAIDKYLYQPQLVSCKKDVTDIVNILTLNYTFARQHVKELYNERATTENILLALDDLATRLDETDSLILLFSGHGQLRKDVGFWIPVDAKTFTSYLPVSTIRDYLEPIKARHIFVIADACFAGSFFATTKSAMDWSAFTERHPSRYAITAGRDEPVLDGRLGENSPFANALKFRLTKATVSIGAILLSELVLQDVVQRAEGFQTPRHGELNIRGSQHGQFFFHRRLTYASKDDPFIDVYIAKGGELLPPGNRQTILEYFDEYAERLNALPETEKVKLVQLNTKQYLAKWGLSVSILKEKLKLLRFYHGQTDDHYDEQLREALANFQRYHMMRQIDGYFGELTYQKMVSELVMQGLARYDKRSA